MALSGCPPKCRNMEGGRSLRSLDADSPYDSTVIPLRSRLWRDIKRPSSAASLVAQDPSGVPGTATVTDPGICYYWHTEA
jgi:hypothetical protein